MRVRGCTCAECFRPSPRSLPERGVCGLSSCHFAVTTSYARGAQPVHASPSGPHWAFQSSSHGNLGDPSRPTQLSHRPRPSAFHKQDPEKLLKLHAKNVLRSIFFFNFLNHANIALNKNSTLHMHPCPVKLTDFKEMTFMEFKQLVKKKIFNNAVKLSMNILLSSHMS